MWPQVRLIVLIHGRVFILIVSFDARIPISLPRIAAVVCVVKIVIMHVGVKVALRLRLEVAVLLIATHVSAHILVRSDSGAFEVHDRAEREQSSSAEAKHDENAQYRSASGELAAASRAVSEVVAAAPTILIVIVVLVSTTFALALRDVACHARPCREPENNAGHVERGEGIYVGESARSRPHGYHSQVDENWDRKPAQSKVPSHPTVILATLGEDRYLQCPCQEKNNGLAHMNIVLDLTEGIEFELHIDVEKGFEQRQEVSTAGKGCSNVS